MDIQTCPQCGAPVTPSERRCAYCKAEFFITSVAYLGNFDAAGVGKYLQHYNALIQADPGSCEGLLGLAICYLQNRSYALANIRLSKLVELHPECAPAYYYSALITIQGRRIKTLTLSEIRRIEANLNLATELDPSRPEFKLLLAMVKRDYYETNGMTVPPPSPVLLLGDIEAVPVLRKEVENLLSSVKVGNEEFYTSKLLLS